MHVESWNFACVLYNSYTKCAQKIFYEQGCLHSLMSMNFILCLGLLGWLQTTFLETPRVPKFHLNLQVSCSSNYIPEGSWGYYVVGLDAASAAVSASTPASASAAHLVVLALAHTGINFFFQDPGEFMVIQKGRTLLLLGKIWFLTWPLGGVFYHEIYIFNIFWTESPFSVKPSLNDSSHLIKMTTRLCRFDF